MRWIICYDIPSDSTRQRLARWLDGFGDRIQDSVFEAELDSDLVLEMWSGVERLVDRKEDKVGLVPVCAACCGKRSWIGLAAPRSKAEDVVWVI